MATRSYPSTYKRSREPSDTARTVAALLNRYPDISEQELAALIEAFPYVPALDLGLMTADDRLSGKLEAFHRDHGDKLKTPLSSLVVFLAIPLTLAAGVLWWVLTSVAAL